MKWDVVKSSCEVKNIDQGFCLFFHGLFSPWVLFRLKRRWLGGLCRSQHICKEELGGAPEAAELQESLQSSLHCSMIHYPYGSPNDCVSTEWQRRKNQDYSMAKTSPPESHVLKNIQKCPSLARIQHSSEEMLVAGTSQHLARPGEGTLVFPLCKFSSPISKLCLLLNLLILHCQTNLFCCKELLGLSSSQVHPASCCADSWAGRALTMSQALKGIKYGCFFSQWR